ncbi:hypothetical protein [Methylocapsa aurea]|uniref:hypothetical protein n=1 Tax=Methylocapsa aurea TaxID=663610 RepID=UPI00055CF454|nr:hypothetical protein [Methylocapsa aurea]
MESFDRKALIFKGLEHVLIEKVDQLFSEHALEPDDFGRNRKAISSKILNPPLIKELEHDVVRKPVSTFRHHALGWSLEQRYVEINRHYIAA